MNPEAEKLYNLLPALYRVRDHEQGAPLKALCAVMAEQIAILQEDLEQLYDDQFIETCADWVAPYIGDLIGYRAIHGVTLRTLSARAEVANTIAYRRRKGAATMLEQLARDVTGWSARAVEFFQWLQTSQHMNHIRPGHAPTADLRRWEPLERLGTAFDTLAHSVDVRRIESQKGRYNIPSVGLFLWRLQAFPLTRSPAFRIDDERFLFSPLGHDLQLFTRAQSETDITHLAEPIHVPAPISRRVLHTYLKRYYGPQLSLFLEADNIDTGIANIHICNLSDDGPTWGHLPVSKIVVDPVLGRIALPPGMAAQNLRVTFHYGFSMALGGGEYERAASFIAAGNADAKVALGDSLQDAFDAVANGGLVEILDGGRYEETPSLIAGAAANIEVRAANEHRPALILSGDLEIELNAGAELTLNGLLIAGGALRVSGGAQSGPRLLRLRHCTFVPGLALTRAGEPLSPGSPSLVIDAPDVTVEIDHCILGPIRSLESDQIRLTSTLVDATAATRVALSNQDGSSAAGRLTSANSTIIGKVHSARLELASNTIFLARLSQGDDWDHPVISDQNQQGCLRFSFVPLDSIVPRRYRCQPDLAVAEAIAAADKPKGNLSEAQKAAIMAAVQARLKPAFTSLRYGQPGYGQLVAPRELCAGADDESEMGALHDLFAPQRESNLKIRLQEYLRFGMEAGVFYST
jgi:hypothetical protein